MTKNHYEFHKSIGHDTFHNSFPFIESEWGFGLLPPQLSHATEGKIINKNKGFKFHIIL